jgi:TrkA domain protein
MTQFGDIEVCELPGIGVRYDFVTTVGDRIGLLVHESGERELLLFDRSDPDSARSLPLSEHDLVRLGEMLGLGADPRPTLDRLPE